MSKKTIIGIVCAAISLALVATGVTMYLLGFFRKKSESGYLECDCVECDCVECDCEPECT